MRSPPTSWRPRVPARHFLFCYAFAARSGYPLPVDVVERIGASVDNLAGLKVSEAPFEAVAPYLDLGLPVLIGNEPLIPAGIQRGAIGTVSGMAAAFPEVVRAALDAPTADNAARLTALRGILDETGHFIAAAKHVLGMRGVPVGTGNGRRCSHSSRRRLPSSSGRRANTCRRAP